MGSAGWSRERKQLAGDWTQTADSLSKNSRPRDAVVAYRNALTYDHDNAVVRFRMAQALLAAGETAEAATHLESLLSQEPGKAEYNLALARLSVREHKTAAAERYYRSALSGRWDDDPVGNRFKTSLELVPLLLDERSFTAARAALISLTADMPNDTTTEMVISRLFLQAEDAPDAAAIAKQAVLRNPSDWALQAFYADLLLHLGRFTESLEHFREASRRIDLNADMQSESKIALAAVELNPYARGLRAKDEAARLQSILRSVQDRLIACSPTDPALGQTRQWIQTATPKYMRDDPHAIDKIVLFANEVEKGMSACNGATPADRAIELIGKEQ